MLARWELVERSKVYTKDCTTVRAKESRRIEGESKKAVSEEFLQNKNEKNTKFTTITYKGRVIELPEDIEKTADLSALPAGAVSSYKPGKNKEKKEGRMGFVDAAGLEPPQAEPLMPSVLPALWLQVP